jgi:CheY-like chemotaxis protein
MKPEELRILLIDDNDITREVLRVVLRGQGYQIVGEAGDGDQGLQMALELKAGSDSAGCDDAAGQRTGYSAAYP